MTRKDHCDRNDYSDVLDLVGLGNKGAREEDETRLEEIVSSYLLVGNGDVIYSRSKH